MRARIAIPVPTSGDERYNGRSLRPYVEALKAVRAKAVVVPLDEPQDRVAKLLGEAQGVLLPGSRYDVEPERYGERREPECGEADAARTAVDELLLQDAFSLRKPVLAICYGTQSLNVWRNGSLVQDLKTDVDHRPGRDVMEAHPVEIAEGSRLMGILERAGGMSATVNSSHHQAIREPGDNLRVTAVSPGDGVIEAVELAAQDHFVVAVQWHPERTYARNAFSRGIFEEFVRAAESWKAEPPMEAKGKEG